MFYAFLLPLFLFLLTGCGMREELTEWAAGKANDALEAVGGSVQEIIDDLENAEYQGGPFENNLESARAYLLTQLQEKYGIEFMVVGDENLKNYGAFAGATYRCKAAPADAPEQVTTALVSQSVYQDVRNSYAVYFFKEEAEAPVLALCEAKDYVLDQRISLEMPGTARLWTADDELEKFLSQSGAYVKLVLRLEDDLNVETYAEQILDFLGSVDQLNCNLLLQARANKMYIFHSEINVLDGFDASHYTLEELAEDIEVNLSMGSPASTLCHLALGKPRQKLLCSLFFRMFKYFRRSSLLQDTAIVHKNHMAGHITGKCHLMSHNHHSSILFRQLFHDLQHFSGQFWIKS